MTTTQSKDLQSLLEEAHNRSQMLQKPILVSYVTDHYSVNPLAFFAHSKEINVNRRMYWSEGEALTIIGSGCCFELTAKGDDRFESIASQYQVLLADAQQTSADVSNGTGPVLLGGSSFWSEYASAEQTTWRHFPEAAFFIPQFLLTQKYEATTLTINVAISPSDDVQAKKQILDEELNQLLNDELEIESGAHDIHMNESDIEGWKHAVVHATDKIEEGGLDKVVLSRDATATFNETVTAEAVVKNLEATQKDCFIFAIERDGDCFLGATPERMIRKQGSDLDTTCLAGTIARGTDDEEDDRLGNALLNDDKNVMEHQFVVDMIKGAIEKDCQSVQVPHRPVLYKNKHVQHLYTPITATINEDRSILNLVGSLHPTPALGGTPRDRALAVISELENYERGWYGSPVGWLDAAGNGDFAVAIRSGLLKDKQATLFSGCGIVADSEPESEYKETGLKFKPMLTALGGV
ncbi:isochorismate synthase [Tuberibacillus sp. Marseille-P3662]|uniref:isochorismate synthase n=1 Tax=Tuberibacillus sp. Marseille-P3662 TaxID=1965358 RepID=UPI000A1C9B9C|nr:isochorismate synthase [Tuberibacillus sp. Marseille-P3662]